MGFIFIFIDLNYVGINVTIESDIEEINVILHMNRGWRSL